MAGTGHRVGLVLRPQTNVSPGQWPSQCICHLGCGSSLPLYNEVIFSSNLAMKEILKMAQKAMQTVKMVKTSYIYIQANKTI